MPNEDELKEQPPWYMTQTEEPPQVPQPEPVEGRDANEQIISNYVSPREDSSLLSPLGGAAQAPAGGALLLPLLMAQQAQGGPLGAFANAYGQATGRPSQGMSQYQQFQIVHSLVKDQRQAQVDQERQAIAQAAQKRLAAKEADRVQQEAYINTLKTADGRIAIGKTMMAHPDQAVRDEGLNNILSGWQAKGVQVGQAAVEGLRQKIFTTKDLEDAGTLRAKGFPREIVMAKTGLNDQQMNEIDQGVVRPLVERTRVADATAAAKLQQEEFKVISERAPELKDPQLAGYFTQQARSEGKTISKDTPDSDFARWRNGAIAAQNAQTLDLKQKESNILQNQQAALARVHGQVAQQTFQANKQFEWANTPANMTGHVYMNSNGQTATVEQMQKPERTLGTPEGGGFFRATPQEMKTVASTQMFRAMWDDTMAAGKKANDLGAFAERKGIYATPIIGPLAETAVTGLGLQAKTTANPAMMEALNVFNTKKAAMVGFARAQGDNLRALAAVQPEMDAIDTSRGYPAFIKVMTDAEHAMKAQIGMSRTPGAWDAKPTLMAQPKEQLSAQAQEMLSNGEARLRASMPPGPQLDAALMKLRQKLMVPGGTP